MYTTSARYQTVSVRVSEGGLATLIRKLCFIFFTISIAIAESQQQFFNNLCILSRIWCCTGLMGAVLIDGRIHCTLIQLVTTLHKPLHDILCLLSPTSSSASSRDSLSSHSAGLRSSLYNLGAAPTENTASKQFLYCYRDVFNSTLHRNGISYIVVCVFISTR
jgi:hypothetical protein